VSEREQLAERVRRPLSRKMERHVTAGTKWSASDGRLAIVENAAEFASSSTCQITSGVAAARDGAAGASPAN